MVFGTSSEISTTTPVKSLENWDSLEHIRFLVTIESAFKIRFSGEDANTLETFGDFTSYVVEKRIQKINDAKNS